MRSELLALLLFGLAGCCEDHWSCVEGGGGWRLEIENFDDQLFELSVDGTDLAVQLSCNREMLPECAQEAGEYSVYVTDDPIDGLRLYVDMGASGDRHRFVIPDEINVRLVASDGSVDQTTFHPNPDHNQEDRCNYCEHADDSWRPFTK